GVFAGAGNGWLVDWEGGGGTRHAFANARGGARRFIEPQTSVYGGMLVGLNSRPEDIAVNITKEKKQTNIRSSTAEIAVKLSPPLRLSLEQALDFIAPDELGEVTPATFRMRERRLAATDGARAEQRTPA